eukprot:10951915-Alexandrium_andersonii.AAC.1
MFAKGKGPENPEAAAYFEIFGEGRAAGDEQKASRALKEFARLFPDGATKPGKPRGVGFELTKYVLQDSFK